MGFTVAFEVWCVSVDRVVWDASTECVFWIVSVNGWLCVFQEPVWYST